MAVSSPSSEQIPDADVLLARWRSVRTLLVLQGRPRNRAATEAACMGALEAWELVNEWRRRERGLGSMSEARALETAARLLQDIVVVLLHEPDDPHSGVEAVRRGWRSFRTDFAQGNRARTAPQATAAAGQIFHALETLLDGRAARAA